MRKERRRKKKRKQFQSARKQSAYNGAVVWETCLEIIRRWELPVAVARVSITPQSMYA
jgi:hypothetical protein